MANPYSGHQAASYGSGLLPLFRNYNTLYSRGARGCVGDEEGTSVPFFKDAADLRKWIMCIEQNRILSDLADVTYDSPPMDGDILLYNGTNEQWEVLNDELIFSGGTY